MGSELSNVSSYEDWRVGFNSKLEYLVEKYSSDTDNVIRAAFTQFTLDSLSNPEFEHFIHVIHDAHPTIKPAIAHNLLLRGIQDDRLSVDPLYPYGYEKPLTWHDAWVGLPDDEVRDSTLEINLRQHLLSNISDRYKTIPLLINLMSERLGDQPSILDVGCSQLHGGKKLVFREQLGKYGTFKNIELLTDGSDGQRVHDRRLSHIANLAIKQRVQYGDVTGLDIRHVDDHIIKRFARSCSFYPDELKIPEKIAEFDSVEALDPDHQRVGFYLADFSCDRDMKRLRDQTNLKQYDIIIFSTVFYQVSDEERITMLVNAMNMLSDKGIVVIQDTVGEDFDEKYTYVTSVIDGLNLGQGEQPLLRWATGRCIRAIPEAGRIAFNGTKTETISDALTKFAKT